MTPEEIAVRLLKLAKKREDSADAEQGDVDDLIRMLEGGECAASDC